MIQRETLSILFYLRNDKARSEIEVPIYLRITVNGKRSEMAIQRYIDPIKWNKSGGIVEKTDKLTTFRRSNLTIGSRDRLTPPVFQKSTKNFS